MKTTYNIIMLILSIIFIIDITGVVDTIKKIIFSIVNGKKK